MENTTIASSDHRTLPNQKLELIVPSNGSFSGVLFPAHVKNEEKAHQMLGGEDQLFQVNNRRDLL
jgi:hypothetical protein